jgi:hypothetical protein
MAAARKQLLKAAPPSGADCRAIGETRIRCAARHRNERHGSCRGHPILTPAARSFLVKPARAIAGSIVFLSFRADAAMSESRQTVRDFQPRQLITAMHVELWR